MSKLEGKGLKTPSHSKEAGKNNSPENKYLEAFSPKKLQSRVNRVLILRMNHKYLKIESDFKFLEKKSHFWLTRIGSAKMKDKQSAPNLDLMTLKVFEKEYRYKTERTQVDDFWIP